MLQASLRVLSERQSGSVIPLPPGRFLIGREEDCHLRPNSELVSRHHCVFTNDDITLRLRDLGSTNGTFVNGERLKGAVVLNAGDRVSVGKLDFEVVIGEPAAAAPPAGDSVGSASDETQFAASAATETHTELPAFAPGMPQVGVGDTAMLPAGAAYPGAPGYAPAFAQPGYPYPGYAPMYPGYYMPNMPYPAMPGYPQQPAAPMPAAPAAPAESSVPEVRLPDPATTGAKPPQPPAPKPEGQAAAAASGNVPDSAANIIKQYLQRRPTTGK